jgi:2-oxoglutarate dehydrogenase E1 component
MPHRGRLNILANVVRKPLDALLHEFDTEGQRDHLDDLGIGTGDVKYHLGTSYDRPTASGKKVHLSLVANPSHLEAVDPVVEGKARAKQQYMGDTERTKVMPVLLHGDAAFASQGVVYETLDLGMWKNFTTGGTIHIIANNQVGFTTSMRGSRTSNASSYPTDVARSVNAPIFHVNGDDPEAVVHTLKLAAEYRQAFKKDVVIDILCYRRFGHNEGDEPRFTQPLMYRMIDKHPSTLDLYREKLKSEGVVDDARLKQMEETVHEEYNKAFQASATHLPNKADWFSSYWKGFKSAHLYSSIRPTAVPDTVIAKIGNALSTLPPGMKLHPFLEKMVKRRQLMFETGKNIDWATAEHLAFGSLALEGNLVRLTGQDVERGTFSHRHAVLHDKETGETYQPLRHIDPAQAPVYVHNSSLSEYAVLGFELGFSLENPNSLIAWEAQFGDFANGAQVIVDQFISSGEQKWLRQSGLVMLLPHGYDGQGPEHSSARLERFLQLSDSDPFVIPEMDPTERRQIQQSNIQVVNVTTPANYFHVLRRQVHRDFRKPLIVMSPKRLLRHPKCVSNLDEFSDKGPQPRFRRVLNDTAEYLVADDRIRKVLFCSGNVYYDLAERREQDGAKDVAIVRLEQIAPFPFDRVAEQARRYPNAQTAWVQEEPMNMGAWNFVSAHMRTALKAVHAHPEPAYIGRAVSASTATGSAKAHKRQLKELLDAAFS